RMERVGQGTRGTQAVRGAAARPPGGGDLARGSASVRALDRPARVDGQTSPRAMTFRTGRVLPWALPGSTFLILQWLGRRSGSTRQERLRSLPGDGVVPRPQVRTDHARTVSAPPEAVWPWL